MSPQWFAVASGLFVLVGAPFYLRDILKGKTKPQRTTWLIWTSEGVIAFASQALMGAHWSLVYVGLEALGNLTVYLLSLKYGVGGWSRQDKIAMTLATLGLTASIVLRQPILALLGVVVADSSGIVLTIAKAYRHPASETTLTWVALSFSAALAVGSVGSSRLDLLLYPLYLAVSCALVPVAQYIGHLRGHRKLA